jgi:hypothetical protein
MEKYNEKIRQMFMKNFKEFDGKSMEFHGIPLKEFSMEISMEFSLEISMEFHGIQCSMENSMNLRNDFRQGSHGPHSINSPTATVSLFLQLTSKNIQLA